METPDVLRALAALAHDSRLRIFRLLVTHAPDGLVAGVVAERLGIPPATLSFHLKELSHAGLVAGQQQGRHVRYRAETGVLRSLVGFLTDDCCGGDPARCAPAFDNDSQRAPAAARPQRRG